MIKLYPKYKPSGIEWLEAAMAVLRESETSADSFEFVNPQITQMNADKKSEASDD